MHLDEDTKLILDTSVGIVTAFVAHNAVPAADLPGLFCRTFEAIQNLTLPQMPVAPKEEPRTPAVPIKKSIADDYLICLEDGKKFKSLKRHLQTRYSMSPDDYRNRWGLEPTYPMVAPNYARARSALAKEMGLGQARKKQQPAEPPAAKAAPSKRAAKAA